ncbi:hypothetical protein TNCV_1097741 [Trichonephila clavipes]|nr:hypothetical protein TNCV_1097741 [Trichonephila clavipes]
MPRRRIRAHYEQMSEFERGHIIELKEEGWCLATNPASICVQTIIEDVFGDSQGSVSILLPLLQVTQALSKELWSGVPFILKPHPFDRHYRHTYSTSVRPRHSPCDFYLFPSKKKQLLGRRFVPSNEMKATSLEVLRAIAKDSFQLCFQKLYERWQKCIVTQRVYLEGGSHLVPELLDHTT